MRKKYAALLLLLANQAHAWLCPNNFNTINPGDPLEIVKTQCGNPLSEQKTLLEPNVPQEWGYYVKVNPPNPATIRMSVVIANKKVTNITVNAMSLTSTDLCGGTISVGQSMEAAKAACGNPMFLTKQPLPPNFKPTEQDALKYSGPAPNILVFENGFLKERK